MPVRASRRCVIVTVASLLSGCVLSNAQTSRNGVSSNSSSPLEAELTSPLVQSKLKPGTPFVARVLYKWVTPQCTVPSGALAVGEVVATAVDTQHKTASVTLRFNPIQCPGRGGAQIPVRMYALIIPPMPLSETDFANRGGLYTGYASIIPDGASNDTSALHGGWDQASAFSQINLGKAVTRGSVIGSKYFSLETDGRSEPFTIHQKGKKIEMYSGAVFILSQPAEEDFGNKVKEIIAKTESTPQPFSGNKAAEDKAASQELVLRATLEIEQSELCSEACNVVPSLDKQGSRESDSTGKTIDLERYGYSRVAHHPVQHFSSTDSITYLDNSHLLVTFDRHIMRKRLPGEIRSEYERSVRAVVIETKSGDVKKIVDWKVQGDLQYVWPAGKNRTLLHLGNRIYLVASDLTPIKSFELSAPLAWLVAAPNGSRFAVGLLHELHNQKLHEILKNATGKEPEESIAVTFLDGNLEPTGTSSQPSFVSPPLLSANGEIRVVPERDQQWHLQELIPDGKKRRLATLLSDCAVHASMPSTGIVFIDGCGSGRSWYRAYRTDGHLVLRGASSSNEVEQAATGDETQRAIAVRVVQTETPQVYNPEFRQEDVDREQIAIYQTENGKLLLSRQFKDVPFTEQSFAISPNDQQLAVLGTTSLHLVSVPAIVQ